MNENELLIKKLYDALANLDYQTMQSCYHPEAHFEDPAFGKLDYEEVCAMWEMLCKRAEDFNVEYSNIHADQEKGSCNWIASYTFSRTKRKVINKISSKFTFKEGKILNQKDSFNLWNWSRQSLGTSGFMLGWFPPFQHKIRDVIRSSLNQYLAQK